MSGESPKPDGGKLQNPFSKDKEGFLGFCSSTPSQGGGPRGGGNFKPKRGKPNRLNNWERFGEYVGESDRSQQRSNFSPYRGGNNYPSASPRGFYSPSRGTPHQYRGSPGHFQGSPGPYLGQNQFRGNRGGGGGQTPRGYRGGQQTPRGYRGGQQQHFASGQSYFHPSMLENPWADILASREVNKDQSNLSDSLCANAGQSILERSAINPAPDVADRTDYSSGDEDEGMVPSPIEGEDLNDASLAKEDDVSFKGDQSISDSMIPMVGDSIMNNDVTTSSV